ncbi:hypothetical protein DSO57_1008476 [Entomophthora muscae]|uniref:Uncharacterized protein n=1 Tax=Entomophthora muscae TaxID=34485 RepID=A0ACC2SW77_9FUNG|nr:hypothetical protein DSO57_1008476 [Entomophthora muscae]
MAMGLYFLLQCAQKLGGRDNSYASVAKVAYPDAAILFDLVVAAKCFGLGVSYFIVIGDLMPQVMMYFNTAEDALLFSRHLWVLVFSMLLFPLALIRKLDSLYYASFVALFSVGLLLWIILWGFLTSGPINWEAVDWIRLDGGFYSGFPILLYAFSCHENIFSVYNELLDNSAFNLCLIVNGAIGSSVLVYAVVGILGYLTYGSKVCPNILAMYNIGPLLTLGRIAVVLLATFSYPFQSHPCRAVLLKLMEDRSANGYSSLDAYPPGRRTVYQPYFYTTAFIVAGNCCVALLVCRLDRVLALVGSVGSTSIALTFPAIMYLRLDHVLDIEPYSQSTRQRLQRGAAYLVAAFGTATLLLCTSYNIYTILD